MFADVEIISNNTYKFQLFTYSVPKNLSNKIDIGSIVSVNFRNRKKTAVVVNIHNKDLKIKTLKPVEKIISKLDQDQLLFLKHVAVSYYLNIGFLIFNLYKDMNFKLDRKIKNSSLSIYNNTEIDKVLSTNSKNIIFTPSLKATKNLYKNLSEKGIKINFYQKTGGKDEIQNALSTVNKFNNCILLANNFMKIKPQSTSNYHFFDTNDYSYNLPKFNSLNIIELSVLKNKYFGGNYHYYNEYPSLNYFNKIKNYKTPDLSNVEIYHGNSLQDCIELFKTKHTDKNLKLFFHDEILNELLYEYKAVKSENDLYDLNLLVNPTISFKGKLNSERLIFLLRQIERSKRNNSLTIILTTKNINLKESLKNSNITKWSKEELVSRNKWGPNLNHKVFKFSSDSIIKYESEYILGPKKVDNSYEYEININLSKDTNYNEITNMYSKLLQYEPRKVISI